MIPRIIAGILFIFLISCSEQTTNYENIINEIKKQELPVGVLIRYRIDDFSDTSTLNKLSEDDVIPRGKGKGCIWVYKSVENLLVFIETEDNGHAGEFGVVYSKTGENPIWNHDEWGEFWSVDDKISKYWWKISYRLG